MQRLLGQIRERLKHGAYVNEAAISHGVVTPILNALGWDIADPRQLVPEYANAGGRVDFALIGLGRRPAVFIEVKAVGKTASGDRQLFEYAFHEGVPLCVLTDGREWSFYVPSGHGSYEERRVYLLQLDQREPLESEAMLIRYLSRERVRDQSAFEDAQRELKAAAGHREAVASVPRAWTDLLANPEDSLLETIAERAEVICGYKPEHADILVYLRSLRSGLAAAAPTGPAFSRPRLATHNDDTAGPETEAAGELQVTFSLFGQHHTCENASFALRELLAVLADLHPELLPALADRVRTPSRNWVANAPEDIAPDRPELCRALEFREGWWIGTHLSNRSKMTIIRAAVDVFHLAPEDLQISLRNG